MLTDLNVAVLSVLFPNFNFNVVVPATTAFFVVPFIELYIFSLYSATIVTFCPALYVSATGDVTLMLDKVGAVVSATIAFPPIVLLDTSNLFIPLSYTVPVYPVVVNAPLSPAVIVYSYVIVLSVADLNVALPLFPFAAVPPNASDNTGAVLDVTPAPAEPALVPYMFSLYVATIVIFSPALYVSATGDVTFILDNVGSVTSYLIMKASDTSDIFPAASIALKYAV